MATPESNVRVAPDLRAEEALAWALAEPGGALAMMVMSATGSALDATPAHDADQRLREAAQRALDAGALRAVAWHASGRVPLGRPVTIVCATAPRRRVAKAALDLLVDGLSGVAERKDVV